MIAAGEMTGIAMLMATDDYDVEGNETLTLQGAMVEDMIVGIGDGHHRGQRRRNHLRAGVCRPIPWWSWRAVKSTITATASQMVRENTEVMVMRDAASTAGDDDYDLPTMITIMMGETTGTATLTATDDLRRGGQRRA